jgi:hypothetical protein
MNELSVTPAGNKQGREACRKGDWAVQQAAGQYVTCYYTPFCG